MFYLYIKEPAKNIPVVAQADVCVVGGSCTGLFAAVRAARLGLKVVLIEKQGSLGGVATNGLVNIWHSLYDANWDKQVIAGLTYETILRLQRKGDILSYKGNESVGYRFNPQQLKVELDNFAKQENIKLYLHSYFSSVVTEGDKITAVIMENKDGRVAVKASFVIDATGDGDVARGLNIPSYTFDQVQPPTSCFLLQGNMDGVNVNKLVHQHGSEFGLEDDWGWSGIVPACKNITMRADGHVFNVLCSKADDLTYSEIKGREQMHAFVSLLKKYGRKDTEYNVVATCGMIGIRDTLHFETKYKANEMDLLLGKRYDDAVLNGTYRIDIHHSDSMGITFKYLDGRVVTMYGKGTKTEESNWREQLNIKGEPASYYQLPFSVLVGEKYANFIAVGRMINADIGAFGALRVMVNLNQLGEAAGVAAFLSLNSNQTIQQVDGIKVRKLLKNGGSAL